MAATKARKPAISLPQRRWRRSFEENQTSLDLKHWDAADHLNDEGAILAYLEAAIEDGDPALIAAAIGDVARAKGMTEVAMEAGLSSESLYKSLSADGNPSFATVLRVLGALDIDLSSKRHVSA